MKNADTKKRKIEGVVVSDAMQKTRVVAVTRLFKHPKYQKFFKVTKRFKAHDEENAYKKGDRVVIAEARPMSRDKRWTIVEKIIVSNKAADAEEQTAEK